MMQQANDCYRHLARTFHHVFMATEGHKAAFDDSEAIQDLGGIAWGRRN